MNKLEVLLKMKTSYQIQDKQTIFEHGVSVLNETKKILNELRTRKNNNLPDFLYENSSFLLDNLVDYKTLYLYCLYHDCGKPFCKPDS